MGRLVFGMVGFGLLFLHSLLAILGVVSIEPTAAFVLVEVSALALIAAGFTGLRSPAAYVAAAAHAATALLLSGGLLLLSTFDSLTKLQVYVIALSGFGAFAAASSGAACLANAHKLGALRIPAALPWLALTVVFVRSARVAVLSLLGSPDLPSAEDAAAWRTLYLGSVLCASIATGLLLFVANVRAREPRSP